jgi:hypothetical protein
VTVANGINTTTWTPDPAHEPNLAYVPYLFTGSRWYLDRLNAEAAFDLTWDWPGYRCVPSDCTAATDLVLNGQDQVRQQAWSFREIMEASFIGKAGSWEQTYFAKVVADNWAFVKGEELTSAGQATGWYPGTYGSSISTIAPWEQDYLSGVIALDALMGDANAKAYLAWQHPWLTGRFNVPTSVHMNPNDGCAYNISVADSSGNPLTTWAAIEAATANNGQSQGASFNSLTNGDYCPLARAVLNGALTQTPGDAGLTQALGWLNSQAPAAWTPYFQLDPTFSVKK